MSDINDLSRRRSQLSDERRALLDKWTRGSGRAVHSSVIAHRSTYSPVSVSFAQQRLWFLDQLVPDSPAYTISDILRLGGPLRLVVLQRSLNEIVRRHESLRTTFSLFDGLPVQHISPTLLLDVPLIDLSCLPAGEQERQLYQLASQEAAWPFDLARGPLVRTQIVRLRSDEHMLLLTFHHIIADGWSLIIFHRELATLYTCFLDGQPSPLPELPVQYADYSLWQRSWLQGGRLQKQLTYWSSQLAGAPALLDLPTDFPRPPLQTFQGAQLSFMISPSLTGALKALCQQQSVTLFMLLLAAWQTLLARYSGQEVLVGTPIANRSHRDLETLIGFFVNTLVMRTRLDGNPPFIELLERVRQVTLGAFAHQDLPFEKLVEALQPEREMSYTPLFQVMLTFVNAAAEALTMGDLNVIPMTGHGGTAIFDLWLTLMEAPEGLIGILEYNTDLFAPASMSRLIDHLQMLLAAIAADPRQRILAIPLLTVAERHQLMQTWNQTGVDYPLQLCLHQYVEAQVARSPDAIALVFQDHHLSYHELNRRANLLAQRLRALSVGPETLVGVCMHRSLELVLALLAILKSGGAYMPLDPTYPTDRLAFMLHEAGVSVLITQKPLLPLLAAYNIYTLCLDTDQDLYEQRPGSEADANGSCGNSRPRAATIARATSNPMCVTTPDNVAYLMYTSGSTGAPKGIMIPHSGICNRLLWMQDAYQLTPSDRVLQKTPFSFDVSVWEFFWPLMVGARLVLAEPEGHKDGAYLVYLIAQQQITVVHFVPSMLRVFLEEDGLENCLSLRQVMCSGEALPLAYQQQCFARLDVQLHNLYGPTETSVDVTAWNCEAAGAYNLVPIGRPIANTQIYLLDRQFQPVPQGVHGELYIGGIGLARGYLYRPELTAERFLPDPFSPVPGSRLYRTGDLARYLPDGVIDFLGRVDFQVKVRGFRIELGEIEAVLRRHAMVQEAVVIAREDRPDEKQLIAYFIADTDNILDEQTVGARLPGERISQWETVFNEAYGQAVTLQDPRFNFAGWNSSYTGKPIPQEQMIEWIDQTVARVLSLQPRRILEIGCGVGLLLFRLAPHCDLYYGTDISAQAVGYLHAQLARPQHHFPHVQVRQQRADELSGLPSDAFDLVILNSVVQYFPSIDYFVRVLEQVVQLVKPGGSIFIGDVRNVLLLEAFHTSVELYRASPTRPGRHLQQLIQRRMAQEEELLVNPTFFLALQRRLPQISTVQIQLKRGRHHMEDALAMVAARGQLLPQLPNELTLFRYDVTIHVKSTHPPAAVTATSNTWLDWRQEQLTLPALRQLLASRPPVLALKCVPNARLHTTFQAIEQLRAKDPLATAGDMRQKLSISEHDVDPEALCELGDELLYHVDISWCAAYTDGAYDVLFWQHSSPIICIQPAAPGESNLAQPWEANNPLQETLARRLIPELTEYLKGQLPGYMLPSAFVLLNALPLTSNGKIDRRALPAPLPAAPELEDDFVLPRTPIENELAAIWSEILGLERVGVTNNFFTLGGDSIRSIQIVARARRAGIQMTSRHLFQHQTIAELAAVVEKGRPVQLDHSAHGQLATDSPPTLQERVTRSRAREAGSYTPEDFPLAGLDQQALDRLSVRLPHIEDIYPLSPMQQEMLTQYLRNPVPGLYAIHQIFSFTRVQLNPPAFERAWQHVVQRHPVLRTSFLWEGVDRPLQVVQEQAQVFLEQFDIRLLSESEQEQLVQEYILSARQRGFELSQAPQTRLALFQLADDSYSFMWMFNYMLQDGWSFPLLMKDFFNFYNAFCQDDAVQPETIPPYSQYIAWLQQQDNMKAGAFWQKMLHGLNLPPFLVKHQPGDDLPLQEDTYEKQEVMVPLAITTGLQALARQHQLTLNTLLQGAWALFVSWQSGRKDVVFGSIVSGRSATLAGVESMVGFFNNILPVRAQISSETSLVPWLKELQAQQAEARQYEYSTLAAIRSAADLSPDWPLFESYLVFENFPFDTSVIQHLNHWNTAMIGALAQTEHPLRVEIVPGRTLWISLSFYRRFFSPTTISSLLENFQVVLEVIVAKSDQTLGALLQAAIARQSSQRRSHDGGM